MFKELFREELWDLGCIIEGFKHKREMKWRNKNKALCEAMSKRQEIYIGGLND